MSNYVDPLQITGPPCRSTYFDVYGPPWTPPFDPTEVYGPPGTSVSNLLKFKDPMFQPLQSV